jgi:hypothetical protein
LVAPALLALSALLCQPSSARAQQYSIDWHKVAGGGSTSSNGQYAVSGTVGQHDAGGPMTGGNYSLTGGFWSLIAVQTPGAPTLFIAKSGANAVLYWSATGSSGFLLENNSSVTTPGGWTSVSPVPVIVNGTNYVTNTVAPGNKYYRLRHP